MFVTGNDYERTVTELDQKFHQTLQNKKMQDAARTPIRLPKKKTQKSGKPTKKPKRVRKLAKPKKKRK